MISTGSYKAKQFNLSGYKPADRPKYIEAFFSNIDWHAVEQRLRSGSASTGQSI